MTFKMIHENYNVFDLKRSMAFYEEALGLTERHRIEPADGSYLIVYIGNDESDFELELTWLRDRKAVSYTHLKNIINANTVKICKFY